MEPQDQKDSSLTRPERPGGAFREKPPEVYQPAADPCRGGGDKKSAGKKSPARPCKKHVFNSALGRNLIGRGQERLGRRRRYHWREKWDDSLTGDRTPENPGKEEKERKRVGCAGLLLTEK